MRVEIQLPRGKKAEILDKHFDICARLLRFFPNMDVDGFEDSPPTEEERDTILKAIEPDQS